MGVPAPRGAVESSPWKLGRLSLREFGGRLWDRLWADDVLTRSAALAYYFFFALFPALLFLTALLGLLPVPGLMERLLGYLTRVLPGESAALVRKTLAQTLGGASKSLLSIGVVGALWGASAGMLSVMDALNVAHRVSDSRAWWARRLVAAGLTLSLAVFTLTALVLVIFGKRIGALIAREIGLGPFFTLAWNVLQWPVVIACLLLGLLLVYHAAPADRRPLRRLLPGSACAVVSWLLVSLGLRVYVSRVGSYDATYGSIGGVILLMLWFYLSSLTLLAGAEINAAIRDGAAVPGARPPAGGSA